MNVVTTTGRGTAEKVDISPENEAVSPIAITSCREREGESIHVALPEVATVLTSGFWSIFPPLLVQCFPDELVRVCDRSIRWLDGPQPPKTYRIKGLWERYQTAPIRFLDRLVPDQSTKAWLFVALCIVWLSAFIPILHRSVPPSKIGGRVTPLNLACVSRLW